MSERSDRKLRQVAIASYNYRHEAEFAAGFLKEAGIPYRLQIDDPTLGLSVTNSATIWVAAMDEPRARRVLEAEAAPGTDVAESWADVGAWGPPEADEGADENADQADDGARRERDVWASLDGVPASTVSEAHKTSSDLTLRQRVISLLSGVGVASTLAVDAVRSAPAAVAIALAVVAAVLVLAAILGRAPDVLEGILRALSGEAP